MAHSETVQDVGGSGWTFTMPDQVTLSQPGAAALNLSGTSTPLVIDIRLNADLLFGGIAHGIVSINMRELVPASPDAADPSSGLRGPIQVVLHNEMGIPLLDPPGGATMALYAAGVSDQFPTSPALADSYHTIYTHFHNIHSSGTNQTFPGFAVTQQVGPFPGAYPGNPSDAPNWLQLDGTLASGATLTSVPFTFHRRDTAVADDTSINLIVLDGAFDPSALAQAQEQWEAAHGIIHPDGTLALGGTLANTIEAAGDRDLFAVTLAAGQTYAFDLKGQNGSGGTLADPFLRLMDSTGAPVLLNGEPVQNDDYAGTRDSHLYFRATTSGTYYLDVRSYNASATGTYTLSVPPVRQGTAGADLFTDAPGRQFYDGAAGHDTLTLPSTARRGTAITPAGSGEVILAHDGQVDTLLDMEEIRFIDGREVFDPNDPVAQVLRLYQAALGRTPDQPGLHGWTGALQAGGHLSDVAAAFLGSPEFAARFGATQGTAGFVTALYQNALGRAPDAAGLAGWISAIDTGQQTRAQVLMGFSESAENRANTANRVAAGIWDVSEGASEVARLYDTALGRLPDAGGFNGWVTALNGGSSLQALANSFVTSPEFSHTYGALDNNGFVQALYQNALHRAGDAAGVAGWTNALAGGVTRAQVVLGFSESIEHKASTAPNIASNDPSQYGIRLA